MKEGEARERERERGRTNNRNKEDKPAILILINRLKISTTTKKGGDGTYKSPRRREPVELDRRPTKPFEVLLPGRARRGWEREREGERGEVLHL